MPSSDDTSVPAEAPVEAPTPTVEQTPIVPEPTQSVAESSPAQEISTADVQPAESPTVEIVPAQAAAQTASSVLPEAASVALPAPRPSAGAHMREVVRAKKVSRLERIVQLAKRKRIITNNDVEHEFKISDSTATRDLKELVRTGRLREVGAHKRPRYEAI